MYLFRAVDNHGQTVDFYMSEKRDREAAKCFSAKGFGQTKIIHRPMYSPAMACAVSGANSRTAGGG
jgi:IS6 family transposase